MPTKAILPSTWQACDRRRSRSRNCHGATSGQYLRSRTPPCFNARSIDAVRKRPRAPSVHEHPHDNAALRGAHERCGDNRADIVVGVDVVSSQTWLAPSMAYTRRKVLASLLSKVVVPENRFIVRWGPCRRWRRAPRGRRCVPTERVVNAHRGSKARAHKCDRDGRRASPTGTCAPDVRARSRTPR